MKSTLPRVLGSIGALFGLVVFFMGILMLILAAFADHTTIAQLTQRVNLPVPPIWLSMAVCLAGLLSYTWGQGLLLKTDWSPYFAAVYLFHIGLYSSLTLWLLLSNASVRAYLEELELQFDLLSSPVAQVLIVLLPLLMSFLSASLLLRSQRIIAPYADKYEALNTTTPRVCSNPLCRGLLPAGRECPFCRPQELWATLEPLNDDSRVYQMRFRPGKHEWFVTRRDDGEQHQPQTVYLSKTRNKEYETVSRPHAKIECRVQAANAGEQQDQQEQDVSVSFFVVDLQSANRTYVNGWPLPPLDGYTQITDGDELMLGEAKFRFALGMPNTSAPQQVRG